MFKWDDFALDLYSAEKDEVFSLLNITTVEGQRVEIPSSPQPKTANALIRRVMKKGAELLSPAEAKDYSAATMLAPIRKGERVIGVLLIQNHVPGAYTRTRFGNAPDPGRPMRRRTGTRPRRAGTCVESRAAVPRSV